MPEFTTKIFRKIEEIPEKEWDSVFPPALEGYQFFKALDDSGFWQFRFYYLLVYELGKPVGATTFFLMDFQLDIAVQGFLRRLAKAVKRIFPRIFGMKILFCGLPMGQGRIGFAADKGKILEAICASMDDIARQEKALIAVFKDFAASYTQDFQPLLARGFLRTFSLPTTVMNLSFDSFDGYLKTLSRVSREGVKRKLKKIDQGPRFDLEITCSLNDGVAKEVYGLYLQTTRQSAIEFERLPEAFFINISRAMPQQVKFFLWRLDGRLAAFALCLVRGDYFVDYYLGFDYSIARQYNLYFLRFRDLMNWCLANKIKTYEMGQSSYEVKRRLGFKLLPLYVYSKPLSKLLLPFLKFHYKFLMFESFDPVFKEVKRNHPSLPA